ncbi:hypothetical protein BU14_0748s0002 [Porphyra umbilicalis]|uniref:FAS1 domain-containing protein n=1 Tax=Porphyra umbilicalis TaxID=2786 RepID=A0A1X6NPN5_PORUM|nr:hypothetical protein BU14_0748s0002 [Porphyra umbilicalis]|eukprot:OSX70456.1 hypothetical protein BU14_0748s0002 [Porphyra umbilicalis]
MAPRMLVLAAAAAAAAAAALVTAPAAEATWGRYGLRPQPYYAPRLTGYHRPAHRPRVTYTVVSSPYSGGSGGSYGARRGHYTHFGSGDGHDGGHRHRGYPYGHGGSTGTPGNQGNIGGGSGGGSGGGGSGGNGGGGGGGTGVGTMPTPTARPQTIAQIVTGNADFSVLLAALQATGLDTTVADASAKLTVFAPTDAAFLGLAKTLGYTRNSVDGVFAFLIEALTRLADGGDPVPLLASVLKFHVVGSVVYSGPLAEAGFFQPLEGGVVTLADDGVTLYDYAPGVVDPKLVAGMLDIAAANGVIHVIDGVLLPMPVLGASTTTTVGTPGRGTAAPSVAPSTPVATAAPVVPVARPTPMPRASPTARPQTIAQIVTGNSDFSVLLAALRATDLDTTVADASAKLTVFAPTDAAFLALVKTLGYEGDDVSGVYAFLLEALTRLADGGDPVPLLASVLKFHVVGSVVYSGPLAEAGFFQPLEGGVVTLADDGVTLYDYAPGVVDPKLVAGMLDIAAANGVIHVIDGVLLPMPVLGASTTTTVGTPGPGTAAPSVAPSTPAATAAPMVPVARPTPTPSATPTAGPQTIAKIVEDNPNFTVLEAALKAAGLLATVADTSAELTVFAPTDAAFLALVKTLGYEGDDVSGVYAFLLEALTRLADGGDPLPLLASVLKFHVVGSVVYSGPLAEAGFFQPLEGGVVTLADDGVTLYDYAPGVVDPKLVAGLLDIVAVNGVIHVIDGVLLPMPVLGMPEPGTPVAPSTPVATAAPVVPVARPTPMPRASPTARPQTIAQIVTGNSDFSVLFGALQATGLDTTVADASAKLTVFAPTDAAFLGLAKTLGYTRNSVDGVFAFLIEALTRLADGGDPVPLLASVLKFHVVGSVVYSGPLAEAGFFQPLEGGVVTLADDGVTLYDYAPGVVDPKLVAGMLDIAAANGVIHVIDGVLLPMPVLGMPEPGTPVAPSTPVATAAPVVPVARPTPMPRASPTARPQTIAQIVTGNSDFSVLFGALQATGLDTTVADASAKLTVFAPTDAAFLALVKTLGYEGDDVSGVYAFLLEALTRLADGGDPVPLLASVLKFHVVGSVVYSGPLAEAGFFQPLEGGVVTLADDGVTLYDYAPGVVDPKLVAGMLDIAAANGVIHVIDGVLLPMPVLTASTPAPGSGGASGGSGTPTPVTATPAPNKYKSDSYYY